MKTYYIIIFLLIPFIKISQTLYNFSNTTTTSIASSGSATLNVVVSGVPTAGMVLRQVNINFGSTGTSNSGNVNAVTMTLKDVLATSSIMLSSTSFDGAIGDFRQFDIHLRDDAVLKTPKAQKDATSSVLSKGYPFHYGYYKPQGNFSGFNTTSSVNGTWKFVVANGAGGARIFNNIELVFGPAITTVDIRTSKPNQSCATKQCIDGSKVYYTTNGGYPTNQTVTPPNTISGCNWNGQKDNNNWFFFQASSSTAYVSISGLSTVQESAVFTITSCASTATYGSVTNGCAPTDMFVSGHHNQKYNSGSGTYTGGYAWNHGFYLTGLVAATNYVFVIDGSSASVSDFYVEILGTITDCATVLPVELLYFKSNDTQTINELVWQTATETNNHHFELEKSADALNFTSLATINSKEIAGNSMSQKNYTYADVACKAYYRLKQVDNDGAYKYHNIIYIDNDEKNDIPTISPNPATSEIVIKSNTDLPLVIRLIDVSGREVLTEQTDVTTNNLINVINLSLLKNGMYFLSIYNGYKTYQHKIIKQ